jgi:hypothetical protein
MGAPTPDTADPKVVAQLAALLDEARAASPQERIEWRDRIASYDEIAIAEITPWLSDDNLAAFAIRVIWTVGERVAPEEATRTLRSARPRLSPALQGDVDWALASIKAAQKRVSAGDPPAAAARPKPVARARAAPRYSGAARRRTG